MFARHLLLLLLSTPTFASFVAYCQQNATHDIEDGIDGFPLKLSKNVFWGYVDPIESRAVDKDMGHWMEIGMPISENLRLAEMPQKCSVWIHFDEILAPCNNNIMLSCTADFFASFSRAAFEVNWYLQYKKRYLFNILFYICCFRKGRQ